MKPLAISVPHWRRFVRLLRLFARSEYFRPAMLLFAIILVMLVGRTWLEYRKNLTNNQVFTAVQKKQTDQFSKQVAIYLLYFLMLTVVAVVYRFLEEQLGLLLRRGLTQFLMDNYLSGRAYLRLLGHPEVDNPDQRMTDDVKTLTSNALSFLLIATSSILNLIVFSNVLRGITPRLLWAAIGYAVFGSLLTLIIGKRLVRLNIDQLHKEANLRFELVRTRTHAEAIALQHDEGRQGPRLTSRLLIVIENMRNIIVRNAFLGLSTNAFNFLVPIVPILIVAPLVIRGEQDFGTVTQSIEAFTIVVTALSILVANFPQLTLLTAVIARLGELAGAIRAPEKQNGLKVEVNGDVLEVRELMLTDPADGHRFFGGTPISFRVEPGQHTLIVGGPGTGKSELLRALAGLWPTGHGTIIRPPLDRIAFVSSQPYLIPSTLRQLMTPYGGSGVTSDQELIDILKSLRMDELVNRVGGLDKERDWDATLALGERQMIALARLLVLRPRFAALYEVTGVLDGDTRRAYYRRLEESGVTVVTMATRRILPEFHKQQLVLPGTVNVSAA